MRYLKAAATPLFHTIGWIIFLLLPVFAASQEPSLSQTNAYPINTAILSGILCLSLFYYNYCWAVPKFFFRKKYLYYIIAVVVFLVLLSFLTKTTIRALHSNMLFPVSKFRAFYILRLIVVFAASFALRFYIKYRASETERTKAELSSLKAQINPHFLFNTLNGIYGQALIKSDQTADSISRLSSLMRYVITEANADMVPLESEIRYLSNYIELQKLRLTKKTTVIFDIRGETHTGQIPPLLLICFIENAFKYGVSTENETEVLVRIEVANKELTLVVKNDKSKGLAEKTESAKTGLHNIRKRLNIIYGKNYVFNIKQNPEQYEVLLRIKLA
ncbi:MAG: hypothetical protein K0S33_2375 [Bacteroidetes bacterium]|jgi:sensor histidine kinase YesM|nr:hypothetical protein [Bacteroidota bacterium]